MLSVYILPVVLAIFVPPALTDETLKVVCYYGSWATYRSGNGKFTSESINPNLCTHVVYQYTGIAADNGIAILDNWLSLDTGLGDFRKFTGIKKYNPNLKLMVGIGGWNEGTQKFSRMTSSPGARSFFVRSVVEFLRGYGFDGLSIDWMYPGGESAPAGEKSNYVELLKELRQAFAPNKWILAIAGSGSEYIIERGFDVRGISQYVDFVTLLSFDYHGSWERMTGHNSPLYPRQSDAADSRKLNQQHSVNVWMTKGMDAKKLILGIPTYGRSFALQSPDRHSVGAPSIAAGPPGVYTANAGTLGYNELMEYFSEDKSWKTEWDNEQKVPYSYKGTFWISYENTESAKIKAEYILQQGLGGAMIYSLETDDFRGVTGESFPITNIVKKTLASGTSGTWTPPPEVTTDSGEWKPPTFDPNPPSQDPTPWVQPTKPPRPDGVVCTGPGNIKDPTDCSRYYICNPTSATTYEPISSPCPAGLGFNEHTQSCDYKNNIPGCV